MTNSEQRSDRVKAVELVAYEKDRAAWLEKFMRDAAGTFGVNAGSKTRARDLAMAFDQRGYFGFAHFVRTQDEGMKDLPAKRNDKP